MIDKSILLTSTMGNLLGTMRKINAPMLGHKKGQKRHSPLSSTRPSARPKNLRDQSLVATKV